MHVSDSRHWKVLGDASRTQLDIFFLLRPCHDAARAVQVMKSPVALIIHLALPFLSPSALGFQIPSLLRLEAGTLGHLLFAVVRKEPTEMRELFEPEPSDPSTPAMLP
jgi:hypothetical protein